MQIKNRLMVLVTYAFFCVALTGASLSRDIPEGITESFKKGNSRELARHFNNNIELVVLDNEDIYSKSHHDFPGSYSSRAFISFFLEKNILLLQFRC
jgi:hypothetical protein